MGPLWVGAIDGPGHHTGLPASLPALRRVGTQIALHACSLPGFTGCCLPACWVGGAFCRYGCLGGCRFLGLMGACCLPILHALPGSLGGSGVPGIFCSGITTTKFSWVFVWMGFLLEQIYACCWVPGVSGISLSAMVGARFIDYEFPARLYGLCLDFCLECFLLLPELYLLD